MKHIKRFEGFDFSQTIPATTKNFLTNYYSCDECDGIWKEYNKQSDKCKFCDSDEIEELPEDEWYEISKLRNPDESDILNKEKDSESGEFVDLLDNTFESKIYDYTHLPKQAIDELDMYVDVNDPENKIEVYPDPKVEGTYAVRVYRKSDNHTFDLLWNRGGFDEMDGFETWPPKSGNLKFFI